MEGTLASWLAICLFASLTAVPAANVTMFQTSEKFPSAQNPDRLKNYSLASQATPFPCKLTIQVQLSQKQQTIQGFGGAFTESVATIFSQLNATLQEEVLEALWGASGQRYNMARLTIGSTDFATGVYNYNPTPKNYNQSEFSIAHDKENIIPLILRAQTKAQSYGSAIDFLSTSWSPPGWMKAPWLTKIGYMRNSGKPGMIDDPKLYKSYALYLSKYLSAYSNAGIKVSRMTIQNEPDSADHMFPVAYPACNFNGTGEGEFLRDYLGPQVRQDHPDVKIYIHDGQKFHDVPILTRVDAIIAAQGDKAMSFVDGVAFHWYGNNLANYQYLAALHAKYPSLPLLATEATLMAPGAQWLGTTPWKEAQKYGVDIIGDLNAGAEGWIEWNVLLDTSGGPTCIGTTQGTDCTPLVGHCDAPILADTKKQELTYRDSFWIMAHFSRFIPRGSTIVTTSNSTATPLLFTAAITPSAQLVVVILNTQSTSQTAFQVQVGTQFVQVPLMPPHGVQTLVFPAGAFTAPASSSSHLSE